METAQNIAEWSKDPRRKVGCVIVDDDNVQLSGGFNGFPRGIADDGRLNDRNLKNKMVIHAEANAVAAAARKGNSLMGATAYVTHNPCSQCAALFIQAGITRVVYTKQEGHSEDWVEDFRLALELLIEARVKFEKV